MRIKITENGPYIVSGGIPLKEMELISVSNELGTHMELKEVKNFQVSETYALCRCGQSKNAPFCDGSHIAAQFNGEEVADRRPYLDRLTEEGTTGESIKLLDDGRCTYSKFCHLELGHVWELTEQDNDPEKKREAIQGASDCPIGRLTIVDHEGNILNQLEKEAQLFIVQAPEENVSCGIYVRGPVTIEAADGFEYEVRNHVALCRCGQSKNKPYCDGSHIDGNYRDR